jgi:hypothetical protein
MEINVVLRMQNIEELKQFVSMMEAWPALGKALNFEKANEDLNKQAEALRAEVQSLQQQRLQLQSEIHTPQPPQNTQP